MAKIDDRLWTDLLQEPAAELALGVQQPRASHHRSRRPSFAAGGGVAVALAIVAVVLLTAGTKSTPAYGVISNGDGSVTLTLNELMGADAANEQLASLGVRAAIAKVEPGCVATGEAVPIPPSTLQSQEQMVETQKRSTGLSGLAWVIHPNAIPPGDTLVIAVQPANGGNPVANVDGRGVSALSGTVALYHGGAPTCRLPSQSEPAEK
jgi:hypothetical protein